MTITEADITKLASLSRMNLSDDEKAQFAKEIDSILGYVEQIKEVSSTVSSTAASAQPLDASEKKPADIPHRNVMREDVEDKALNDDPHIVVAEAPATQDGYVKVKKILN